MFYLSYIVENFAIVLLSYLATYDFSLYIIKLSELNKKNV